MPEHGRFIKWMTALVALAAALPVAAVLLPDSASWVWESVAPFPGGGVRSASTFAIGSTAYVVAGSEDLGARRQEVWAYDATVDAWMRKADFPGSPTVDGVGFSVGSVGYVCGGGAPSGLVRDCWKYDPVSDAWAPAASFAGAARTGCVAVSIGTKAYVFGGWSGGYLNDLWEYDGPADRWVQKASCPAAGRYGPAAFSLEGHLYVAVGRTGDADDAFARDVWSYDPATDLWTRRNDFPGTARGYVFSASISGLGVLALGVLPTGISDLTREVWLYDPSGDTWTRGPDFPGVGRGSASGMAVDSNLYIGLGCDSELSNLSDFWRLRSDHTVLLAVP
jgi:N-acetylneuraminic acid mutarotase